MNDLSEKDRLVGCVKWFNNKSGYGFVTVLADKELSGKDIFAHHTAIDAKGELYKYLVQGEYVEFKIDKIKFKEHEHQAINITGIMGGDLMCETRNKNKDLTKIKDGQMASRGRRVSTHENEEELS